MYAKKYSLETVFKKVYNMHVLIEPIVKTHDLFRRNMACVLPGRTGSISLIIRFSTGGFPLVFLFRNLLMICAALVKLT